jgi:hypothetical protein
MVVALREMVHDDMAVKIINHGHSKDESFHIECPRLVALVGLIVKGSYRLPLSSKCGEHESIVATRNM